MFFDLFLFNSIQYLVASKSLFKFYSNIYF
jgi:hypothetical protein